jgi:regulator of protease activity HflC (stomatin/prohibitin superfamily)
MSSYVSAAALGCAGLAAFALYERWSLRVADPNEWLLVIRDGKLHRAGIGLRFRASYQDSVVKIPARVYKVQFQAQQVTKEMQGVEVLFHAFTTLFDVTLILLRSGGWICDVDHPPRRRGSCKSLPVS